MPEGVQEYAHLDRDNPTPSIESTPFQESDEPKQTPFDVGYEGDGRTLKPGATFGRGLFSDTIEDLADLEGDFLDNALNAFSKRLITINPPVDDGRLLSLRRSMGVDPEGPLLSPPLQVLSPRQSMIRKQPPSIDFNDWTQNIDPTGPMERAYYNPSDNSVYFLMRTNQRNPTVYDIESPQSEAVINSFKDYALKSILRFAGKKRSSIFKSKAVVPEVAIVHPT